MIVNITINDQQFTVSEDLTILQAARDNNIDIPTLCAYESLSPNANCRICVVEVKGRKTLLTACSTKVSEGMIIETHSEKVKNSRKMTLELMLSRHAVDCHHCLRIGSSKAKDLDPEFCEMCFFCDCVRDGFCELQVLAREYGVDQLYYDIESDNHKIDDSLEEIIRNPNKCIGCRRCVEICKNVQSVHALTINGRGSDMKISAGMGKNLSESNCVSCGRCIDVCPTGSIFARENKDEILYYTHSYDITTAAHISDNVIDGLAKLFNLGSEQLSFEIIASGLKKIGVDYVYTNKDTKKEAHRIAFEYIKKNIEERSWPIILTNSYSAKKFVYKFFPTLKSNLVEYPSEQKLFCEKFQDENIKLISITDDHELQIKSLENGNVDYVVNSRELYRIFKRTGFEPKLAKEASIEFLEYEVDAVDTTNQFEKINWSVESKVKEEYINIEGRNIKILSVNNLGEARKQLSKIKNHENGFDILRIVT